ncbi:MAG: hypothetical protein KAQ68_00700 [Clostridiales bacterium]|nr:hypothetical protein [Clostridiales bacterium]
MKKPVIYIIIFILIGMTFMLFMGCSNNIVPVEIEEIEVSLDEVEEISFGIWGISEPQSEVSLLVYEYIKDKFKIDIKPITLSTNNWKEELDWMVGANQLPDVFVHDVVENKLQFKQLINTGAITPLPKETWGQMKRLSEVLSWYEEVYSVDGQMYFIPRTYQTFDQTNGATDAIYYRSDWAKDLGHSSFGSTANLTDIIDLLISYRSSDPDSNTIWDTWGITGFGGIDFLWTGFLTPFGVRDWVLEDGQWIPGLLSNRAKEAMAWAAQLYRDGIIDPEFDSQTQDEALRKFMSGRAGMVLTSAYSEEVDSFEKLWKEYNQDKNIDSCVKMLPSYKNPMGTTYNEVETFSGGTLVSSNVADTQMYKILDLFNWMYTQQGRNFMTYGQEGTPGSNYKEKEKLFSEGNTELYNLLYISSWNLDNIEDNSLPVSSFLSYSKNTIETSIWPWSHEAELFTKGMLTPELCVLGIDGIAEGKLLHIIKTTRDFDKDWDEFVKDMYTELNIQQAIDEVNTFFDLKANNAKDKMP